MLPYQRPPNPRNYTWRPHPSPGHPRRAGDARDTYHNEGKPPRGQYTDTGNQTKPGGGKHW
eukprot:5889710-Lingulodinium_polyedra.AAC.1